MQTIEIDEFYTVTAAKDTWPALFHTYKILLNLDDDKAAQAVSIHLGVCPQCHEEPMGCQCWNDE